MFDPNIPRWLTASINTYLATNSLNVPVYLNTYQGDQEWCEIRLDGPNIENYEFCSWKIDITINLLITCFSGNDQYRIDRVVGVFGSLLDRDICCYRYGPDLIDDGSQWGILQMYPSKSRKIDVINFGLITPDSKFKRSQIEASYSAWFDGIGS
jgi:hypothetical protein